MCDASLRVGLQGVLRHSVVFFMSTLGCYSCYARTVYVSLTWLLMRIWVLGGWGWVSSTEAWPVQVDLFIFRDPEEAEKAAQDAKAALEHVEPADETGASQPVGNWGDEDAAAAPAEWGAAAPVAGWEGPAQ